MVKVIRKYKTWGMGVFGVLLMVTFLFSGTGNRLFGGDPMAATVVTFSGTKVTRQQLMDAERELETLNEYVPDIVRVIPDLKQGVHWMLLVSEAKKAGLVGEAGDGDSWTEELAQARLMSYAQQEILDQYPQLEALFQSNPQFLRNAAMDRLRNTQWVTQTSAKAANDLMLGKETVARRKGMTPDEINMALAKLRGVLRLVNSYTSASGRMSDAHLFESARRLFEPATLDAVIIDAAQLAGESPEPTPEQIAAHYEAFRAVAPGTGAHGFGYIQPRRVKLEWMQVSRKGIADAVALDPVAVQKQYQLNRTKYPGEFAAEKAGIETELRNAKVEQALSQLDAVYKARVKSATRRLESDGGIKRLPADWDTQRPKMADLAADVSQAVREATGIVVPLPSVTVLASTWTRLDSVQNLPGIGAAEYSSGTRRGAFPDVLGALHEFTAGANLGLQSRVPFETMVSNAAGDRFYFCILDWRDQSSPDSMEEVRMQVTSDLKRLSAYDRLKADLPKYEALAVTSGLEAVGKLFEAPASGALPAKLAIPVSKNVQVTRTMASTMYPALQDEAFRNKVMAAADVVGWTTAPTPENAGARTVTAELPAALSVVVAQLTYPTPITEEKFRTLRDEVVREVSLEEVQAVGGADSPFSFESLKARTGFHDVETTKPAKPAAK